MRRDLCNQQGMLEMCRVLTELDITHRVSEISGAILVDRTAMVAANGSDEDAAYTAVRNLLTETVQRITGSVRVRVTWTGRTDDWLAAQILVVGTPDDPSALL